MRNDLEKLVEAELEKLRGIIADLKIPYAILEECILSAVVIKIYEESGNRSGNKNIQVIDEQRQKFDLLCQAAPGIPRDTIETLSLTYGYLVHLFDPRDDYPGDLVMVGHLMTASAQLGFLMAAIMNNPLTTEIERKKLLSKAGLMGAESRNRPYAALKKWVLENAEGRKEDHKKIARQLFADLPDHLAGVSDDPMRLIYETLRAKKTSY